MTRNDLSSWLASNWIQGVIFPVCLIVVVVSARINKILASVEHMSVNSKRRHEQILRVSITFKFHLTSHLKRQK